MTLPDDPLRYPTADSETEFVVSSTPTGSAALLTDRSRTDAWYYSTHTVPIRR